MTTTMLIPKFPPSVTHCGLTYNLAGRPLRFMQTSKGRSVASPFTDTEALLICGSCKDSFAQELYQKGQKGRTLSFDQTVWAHILAVQALGFPLPTPADGTTSQPKPQITGMARIYQMFQAAAQHLKRPSITITFPCGTTIELKPAKNNGKNPGFIYVTDGGGYMQAQYWGKIAPTGEFLNTAKCPPNVSGLLQQFANDPEGVAAACGKQKAHCCFCQRELTDPKSLAVGYGKDCAAHFGLAYG